MSLQRKREWTGQILQKARLAHLATASVDGRPHVIPVCFTLDTKKIYSPIDEKPKRSHPLQLRRVRNIKENPKVSLVVDHYSEDWRKLCYVIVEGRARIISRGRFHRRAVLLLRRKYRQYSIMKLKNRPIIQINPTRVVAWRSSGKPA